MGRRTKIVATIGPASGSAEMIAQLLDNGVNVFRLNFSHGTADGHREQAKIIRQVLAEKKVFAAILGDLQGPKIRIGDLAEGSLRLTDNSPLTLTIDKRKPQTSQCIPVSYQPLPESVATGDILLLDDGMIRLEVKSVERNDVHCHVTQGGLLKSRKGLNRLGGGLSAPAITEKDFGDIELAAQLELDYLAVSFPSCAEDLDPVKEKLSQLNIDIAIIAKIERAEAVATDAALDGLIAAADGVMVARGDLGVEIGDANLISVQKKIITRARQANKPVITATQMMESMIHSPVPTRAEVFDVANAVLDGTDAVMLSAETATGAFPTKVVAAMAEACEGAERHPNTQISKHRLDRTFSHIDEAIAMSAIYAANHMENIFGSICITESGKTALMMSRLSSSHSIYGLSRSKTTCNRLALYRGVVPVLFDFSDHQDDIYNAALAIITAQGEIQDGQRVTITTGDIVGAPGFTNSLTVLAYRA